MEKQFKTPAFYFQWHFLNSCNLRCKHCYQDSYNKEEPNFVLINKIIFEIKNALDKWNIDGRISLTGGEPFFDKITLFYILDRLSNVNRVSHIGILTNGTIFSAETIKTIKKYKKIKEIQISLDGATSLTHNFIRGQGTFEKSVKTINMLVKEGIFTSIMFTANNYNYEDVPDIIDLANDLNVSAITVERYTPFHENDELALNSFLVKKIFNNVLEKKKEFSNKTKLKIRTSRPLWALASDNKQIGGICPVGFSCLTIMPDGIVYPCRRLPIKIGDLNKENIFKIWYTSPILWKLRNRTHIEQCSNCNLKNRCGGCRAAAFAYNKNFMGKDPLCWKI